MASLLPMPAPAAGVHDVLLLEWSIEESGQFAVSDVLAVVETDKAVIEIEAESDGVLHRRLVPAGQQVEVGTPIAVIGAADDTDEDIAAVVAQAGAVSATGAADTTDGGGDAAPADTTVAGGDTGPADSGDADSGDADSGDAAAAGADEPGAVGSGLTSASPAVQPTGGRIFASPIARRMAKDAGLSLTELTGTGPGGRIVRRDVESAAARGPEPAAASAVAPPAPAGRSFTDRPHSRIRGAIARRLTASKQQVPHFYLRATARVDALLALRTELNTGGGQKVSVNDLVVRAVARAHRAVPEMNVVYTEAATRAFDEVDVAVAIATDSGLVTPVITDADRRSITDIAAATADVAQRARAGRLHQSELEGGSITVTNLGMFGVEEFAAIINPPQSAILAVGAARREPLVDGDDLVPATVMHLTLSVDHRPLDGVVAARWLAALVELITHPVRILA